MGKIWQLQGIPSKLIRFIRMTVEDFQARVVTGNNMTESFNLFTSAFKWLQTTFAYDILFARHLNFSTWFTKPLIFREPKKME